MKVRLNDDREVVKTVREGLKRTGGYCPAAWPGQRRTGVCAGSSRTKSPIRTLKATAIVGCTTKRNKKSGRRPDFLFPDQLPQKAEYGEHHAAQQHEVRQIPHQRPFFDSSVGELEIVGDTAPAQAVILIADTAGEHQ